jgi:hypothetical protein
MPLEVFDGRGQDYGEHAYLKWLAAHPEGRVLNTWRRIDPDYLALHRTNCPLISRYKANDSPGGFTEDQLVKICADTVDELREWVRLHARSDGMFTTDRCTCRP